MQVVTLKPGRTTSLQRRHPWIFSGAIDAIDGAPQPGETVQVRAADGTALALGAYSPRSQIAVRVWTFDPTEPVSPALFRTRLSRALAARRVRFSERATSNAYRLVNAESDGLPGLVVDAYAEYVVCQFLSVGAEFWKGDIVAQLADLHACTGIYERSDVDVREKEGLPLATGVLWGAEPLDLVEIQEGECRFWVDIQRGHKTGFYLDQRENRALMAEHAGGCEVLNGFAYTGAFGVWALKGGAAHVINVEASAAALDLARRNVTLNGLDPARVEAVQGDVFHVLRQYRDAGRQFDLIVLDPPRFAESRGQVERAARGYKDINLLALKLLRPGGRLFTFSCSSHVSPDLFQKIIAGAALDSGREVQIIRRMTQAPDHPVALCFPEGEYLKGLVCQVG